MNPILTVGLEYIFPMNAFHVILKVEKDEMVNHPDPLYSICNSKAKRTNPLNRKAKNIQK